MAGRWGLELAGNFANATDQDEHAYSYLYSGAPGGVRALVAGWACGTAVELTAQQFGGRTPSPHWRSSPCRASTGIPSEHEWGFWPFPHTVAEPK